MMPKNSHLIQVMEEAYRGYLETVKGQGAQHEHGPPHLHRGLALLKEMTMAGAVPAEIQTEFTAFKKWVEELHELPMAEACVPIRQCQYADVKDHHSGQIKAHRLHIHFEAMVVVNQKIYTINQLVVKFLAVDREHQPKAGGPPATNRERNIRQALKVLIGGKGGRR